MHWKVVKRFPIEFIESFPQYTPSKIKAMGMKVIPVCLFVKSAKKGGKKQTKVRGMDMLCTVGIEEITELCNRVREYASTQQLVTRIVVNSISIWKVTWVGKISDWCTLIKRWRTCTILGSWNLMLNYWRYQTGRRVTHRSNSLSVILCSSTVP